MLSARSAFSGVGQGVVESLGALTPLSLVDFIIESSNIKKIKLFFLDLRGESTKMNGVEVIQRGSS